MNEHNDTFKQPSDFTKVVQDQLADRDEMPSIQLAIIANLPWKNCSRIEFYGGCELKEIEFGRTFSEEVGNARNYA